MKNKAHFSLCVFDCDLHDALLILVSVNKARNMVYFLFKFLLAKKFERKGRQFYDRPRAALGLVGTPLVTAPPEKFSK